MSLTSLAALQVEVTPIVPDVRSTRSTMRAPTEHKKISAPISLFLSAKFAVMWQSDSLLMATSPCVSENLCVCVCVCVYFLFFFVLSVWCWCYLCRWWMAEDHMKWLRALAWPTFLFSFFNHSVIVRSKCDASQLLQFCWALMCCPEMSCELWACQWVCTFREGWIRLERGHDFDWSESGL